LTALQTSRIEPEEIGWMNDTFVDVKAVLGDGSHAIIEMQVLNAEGLEKRILYNAAKKYASQRKKGDGYSLLNPVIELTITDFVLFDDLPDMISRFKLIEKKELIEYRKKDWVYIQKSSIDLAKRQGLEQGLEQVVMTAYRAEVKFALIAQLTGLGEEQIKAIIRRNQRDEK